MWKDRISELDSVAMLDSGRPLVQKWLSSLTAAVCISQATAVHCESLLCANTTWIWLVFRERTLCQMKSYRKLSKHTWWIDMNGYNINRYQLNSIVNCYGLFRGVLINLQLLICSSSGPSCIAPDVDSPLTLAPRKHCRRCKSNEGKSKPSTVEWEKVT